MALRVLLADESVTIKKVIQLALQDFAVEVKAVPVGVDVLEVSKSFQPDLVFADILLQKRSGYEVCTDLKKDATTAAIPVVLMWSSFMELDQAQVDSCGADGKLEKPFEVEALRRLVLELVPRTRSQRLAHFLEYPPTIAAPLRAEMRPEQQRPAPPPTVAVDSIERPVDRPTERPTDRPVDRPTERPAERVNPPAAPPQAPPVYMGPSTGLTPAIPERPVPLGALPDLQLEDPSKTAKPSSGWNMDSFEPMDLAPLTLDGAPDDEDDKEDSFQPIQLPQAEPSKAAPPAFVLESDDDEDDESADQWANRSLDKYRLAPLKPEESLATDEHTPDFSPPPPQKRNRFEVPDLTETTEILATTSGKKKSNADWGPTKGVSPAEDLPAFSLSDDDFDRTSLLEIEHVEPRETQQQPSIVRELLRDPDFSIGAAQSDAPVDLSQAGRRSEISAPPTDYRGFNAERTAPAAAPPSEISPQLEKAIERAILSAVEKTVAELLPKIAERIIKRELERLLDES